MATIEEVKTRLRKAIKENWNPDTFSVGEACDDVNDANRDLIEAVRQQNGGKVWLGKINLSKTDNATIEAAVWEHDGTALVRNFGCAFMLTAYDDVLVNLLIARSQAPYTGTKEDGERMDAIMDRIKAIGGECFMWS